MASATRVGAFVVGFAALLVFAFALLQRSVFEPPVARYVAEFADAGGVTTGSRVLLAGVVVGSVETVGLAEDGKARVGLALERSVKVPQGTVAVLPASFVSIGDQRLLLVPPSTRQGTLAPGSVIPGRLGSPLDSLAPESGKLFDQMNATMVALQKLLEDRELRQGTTDLLASAKQTSDQFAKFAGSLDSALSQNSGQLSAMLKTTSAMLQNLQVVSVEVRRLVASGELEGKANALLDNLNESVVAGKALVQDLQAFVTDPELKAGLKGTLDNVKVMTDSGVKVSGDFELIARNGVAASEETVTLLKKANRLADEVGELIEKFNRTVGGLTGGGKGLAEGLEIEAGIARESNPGRFRTDVNATLPLEGQKVTFGLYDAFESNKLNLQLSREIGPKVGLRYGVYASKPGLGVDYAATSKLGFRTDLFGFNEPQFDLRLRYDFGDGVGGWAGVEEFLGRNKPAVGVTVRR